MKPITLIVLGMFLVGCGESNTTTTQNPSSPASVPGATGTGATSAPANADNSGVNKRDDKNATLTPLDQGGSEADRAITAGIRKAVMAEKGLSVNAQNVKIITIDGKVTLRGPVNAADEREKIAELAKGVAGVTAIDNQLEVKQPN